jgi:hypothetical protein
MTAQLTHEVTQAETTGAGRGRLREAWHRIYLAIREMNYASRRIVEVQAPWCVDKQSHSR